MKKEYGIIYGGQLLAIVIVIIIENILAGMQSFSWKAQLAFFLFAYVIVTFVAMLIICVYEDVYLEYSNTKAEDDEGNR